MKTGKNIVIASLLALSLGLGLGVEMAMAQNAAEQLENVRRQVGGKDAESAPTVTADPVSPYAGEVDEIPAGKSMSTPKDAVVEFVTDAFKAAKLPKERILQGDGTVEGFCGLFKRAFGVWEMARSLAPRQAFQNASTEQKEDYFRAARNYWANQAAQSFVQNGGATPNLRYKDAQSRDNHPTVNVEILGNKPDDNVDVDVLLSQTENGSFLIYDIYTPLDRYKISIRSNFRSQFRKAAGETQDQAGNLEKLTKVLWSKAAFGKCQD